MYYCMSINVNVTFINNDLVQHNPPGGSPAVPGPPGPVSIPDKQRPLAVPVAGPGQVKVPGTEGIPRPFPGEGQGRDCKVVISS